MIILQINDVIDTRVYYVAVLFDFHNLMCHRSPYTIHLHYTYACIQNYVDAQGCAEGNLFFLSSFLSFSVHKFVRRQWRMCVCGFSKETHIWLGPHTLCLIRLPYTHHHEIRVWAKPIASNARSTARTVDVSEQANLLRIQSKVQPNETKTIYLDVSKLIK